MSQAVRSAAVTMAAVLGALATTVLLGDLIDVPVQASVLAVVLSLMLGQAAERGVHVGLETAAEMVVVSAAAAGVAWLLVHVRTLGQVLLVIGLSVGIAARRYDGPVRRAARIVALPFLALLVTPVPAAARTSGTVELVVWSAVAAVVAVAWTAAVGRLRLPPVVVDRPSRRSSRRLDVPTRMALQMLVGLTVALVVGRALFDDRWAWCVLSAFLVASGNRGRGDVAHKAGLRVVGALVGTVVATLAALHVPPGQRSTLVVLFVVMALALVLRHWSYAYWAAGMTAMLSLLHAYYGSFGQTGAEQLRERLVGVALGSAIGLAAAWWVLPVRTRDVFRARVADCLRAINEQDGSLPDALAALDQLVPTLRAGARTHPGARRQLAAVGALHDLEEPSSGAVRRDVGRIRRSLVGRDDPDPDELLPELRPVYVALRS
ncbi:FUSC family protein [Nocardioides sp. CN2-186]|uniref:FUSC family protein n=1 Tax=Nocardioides tweenelious TaxID=3156607 RepID=UPI0032B5EB12